MGFLTLVRVQWDRIAAGLAVLAGVVVLVIGWVGTAHTEYVAKQLPYVISAGIGGLFLLGVGVALWISADLRDEWREMRTLSVQIRQEQEDRRALAVSELPTATLTRVAARPRGSSVRTRPASDEGGQ